MGVTSATLEVRRSNSAARQLYEGAGFTPSGVRPGYSADPREDALIYWRHESDHPMVATLYWDVARQFAERAVDDTEFETLDDWPERSIGAVLSSHLRTYFPEKDLDAIRKMRSERSEEFHSTLQGGTGLAEAF